MGSGMQSWGGDRSVGLPHARYSSHPSWSQICAIYNACPSPPGASTACRSSPGLARVGTAGLHPVYCNGAQPFCFIQKNGTTSTHRAGLSTRGLVLPQPSQPCTLELGIPSSTQGLGLLMGPEIWHHTHGEALQARWKAGSGLWSEE